MYMQDPIKWFVKLILAKAFHSTIQCYASYIKANKCFHENKLHPVSCLLFLPNILTPEINILHIFVTLKG